MGHVLAEAAVNGDVPRIQRAVLAAVDASWTTHPMRHRTRDEAKRRTEICVKWIKRLCEECRWPIDRALSNIRPALVAELNGHEFNPHRSRTLYVPDEVVLNPDSRNLEG